jgi:hypothetical protein
MTPNTIIKLIDKLYKVLDISEFGARVPPVKKISKGKYQNDGKARFISANTDAKVIK